MLLELLVTHGGAGAAARVVALLLVHGAHALLWAAAAALLARLITARARVVAALWKLALLGPLLTTALALHAGPEHEGARPGVTVPVAAVEAPGGPERRAGLSVSLEDDTLLAALAALACAASGLGTTRFVLRARQLVRHARSRRRVDAGRLSVRLAALCARAGQPDVVLSELPGLRCPMVLGRNEICVPTGVLDAFPDPEVDAVLAHELAHLAHRDGLWFLGVALLEALFCVQPLSRWAAVRFRHAAELAADDRATALTGRPEALARALTRMAALQVTGAASLSPALSSSAALHERVGRLVRREGSFAVPRAAWLPVLGLSLLAVLAPWVRAAPVERPLLAVAAERDAQARYEQLDLLRARVWALETELAAVHLEPDAADATHVLELEQDLRHARASEQWAAARLASAAR